MEEVSITIGKSILLSKNDLESVRIQAALNQARVCIIRLQTKIFLSLPIFSYTDEVTVTTNGVVTFRGLILSSKTEDTVVEITCSDYAQLLKENRLNAEFQNFTPPDIIYHIVKPVLKIGNIPKGKFTQGINYHFRIVIPFRNLIVNQVLSLTPSSQLTNSLPETIRNKIESCQLKLDFLSSDYSYIINELDAPDFLVAYQKSYEFASIVYDWLIFRSDISSSTVQRKINTWERENYLSKINLTPYFFGELTNSTEYMIGNGQSLRISPSLQLNSSNLDDLTKYYFGSLAQNNTPESIKYAIHFLRRSGQSEIAKDSLLDMFTSLEFILSGQKALILFPSSLIDSINENVTTLLNDAQKKRFKDILPELNSPSFMFKLDLYCRNHAVPISSDEIELLKKMRLIRNNIVHGYSVGKPLIEDLEKLRFIIEKILIPSLT